MNKILKLAKHPLISGSGIIFTSSLLANFIHYLFNLIMGRLLTPTEYGLIASLISLTALLAVFQGSLTSIFAKFAAKFKASKDEDSQSDLIKKGFNITLIFASLILIFMLIFTSFFMQFLHVFNLPIILLTYLYIFFAVMSALPMGIFQGEMRIFTYSFVTILNALIKVTIGVLLVLLGLKVGGAMAGVFVAMFISYSISLYLIRKYIKAKSSSRVDEQRLLVRELKDYGSGFFLAALGISLFSSADIILARHFFPPVLAGQYAALSVMGKAIFYVIFPINFIFFPLIAQKRERKENVTEVLLLAALIITVISTCASFVYFLFPNLILQVFFPAAAYKILAPYLGPFSLYILIFSIASLLNSYLLSIGKTQIFRINILCGFLLVGLIFIFHQTMFQFIGVLFTSSLLLLLLLLIYYFRNGRD